MSSTKTSRVGSLVAFGISALFIAAAGWIFFNRQFVLDQLSVWSYEPPSNIASVEERVQFTDKGKFLFYATRPSIETQSNFNKACPRQETGSPILGCYTTDDRIYIYNLTNEQLDGMKEVTAAHEMLHAAWYRTDSAAKDELTAQLKAAYEKINDSELKERMAYYERTEPGEFINELHSILGTEQANLGEPLESYYAQFFNRSTVLGLHAQYNGIYTALYTRADELYSKMDALSNSLNDRSSAYDSAAAQLSADITTFNARARGGTFTSQSQFNAERAQLMQRSNALESDRAGINADIATYNVYYDEYQDISKQIEVLNESIDSFKEIDQAPSV